MDEVFRIALDTKRRHGYNWQEGKWIKGFVHSGTVESEVKWAKWKRLQEALRQADSDMTYEDLINRVMRGGDE